MTARTGAHHTATGQGSLFLALVLAAVALRPQLVALGPLEDEIRSGLGISRAAFGVLSALPLVGMGVFALGAAPLARRVGTRTAVALALWILTAGSLLRVVAPGYLIVVATTIALSIGMGLGNALPAMVVKERAPLAAATGTAAYTAGIQIGATIAAALAVPLSVWAGGWRASLAVIALLGLGAALTWPLLVGHAPQAGARTGPAGERDTRVPAVWRPLAGVLAATNCMYYGVIAWVSADLIQAGWSASAAGLALAVLSVASIISTVIYGMLGGRIGTRASWAVCSMAGLIIGLAGIVLAPGLALVWALIFGLGNGSGFAAMMTFPLDLIDDPAAVAAVAGRMLLGGYVVGAIAPPLLGLLRDMTGSYVLGFAGLIAFVLVAIPIVFGLGRRARG